MKCPTAIVFGNTVEGLARKIKFGVMQSLVLTLSHVNFSTDESFNQRVSVRTSEGSMLCFPLLKWANYVIKNIKN